MKLIDLEEGAVFRVEGMPQLGNFKLLRKHETGCTVRPTRLRFREFITHEGKEVAFEAPGGKSVWSASTPVIEQGATMMPLDSTSRAALAVGDQDREEAPDGEI
jgi:hypothetical protein